jgi:CRP-like cAMP-binding protein
MHIEDSVVASIFKDISYSQEETDFINSKFKKIILKKGDVLLTPDTFVDKHYYITSGCLRSYFIKKNGKEYTVQFAIKDWWISDYTAYFTSGKSKMSIECIQDATIHEISRQNMELLYTSVPDLQTFFRRKLESAFASFQRRILGYLSQSAQKRYLEFMAGYPNIEKSIKNYHIASYLGITTESLSRIRKNLGER